MLRIILWRLGFEFWNLVVLLMQMAPSWFHRLRRPVHYFGFGANLAPQVLAHRHMRPLAQQDIMLPDHELRFNQPGPHKGFGFASVHKAPGEQTFGRLITMRKIDEIRMDYYELVPFLHKHRKLTAEYDGKRCFFYQATRPQDGLRPTAEYLGKIMQAVEQSPVVPADYLEQMRAIRPLEELLPPEDPQFVIDDYDAWGATLTPLRKRYDVWCIRLFMWLYEHAPTQKWLNARAAARGEAHGQPR